jgi:hypothetical protein
MDEGPGCLRQHKTGNVADNVYIYSCIQNMQLQYSQSGYPVATLHRYTYGISKGVCVPFEP